MHRLHNNRLAWNNKLNSSNQIEQNKNSSTKSENKKDAIEQKKQKPKINHDQIKTQHTFFPLNFLYSLPA